jgi:hypothetical protein
MASGERAFGRRHPCANIKTDGCGIAEMEEAHEVFFDQDGPTLRDGAGRKNS